jgi:DNA-binding MarR family transcriptional regulator
MGVHSDHQRARDEAFHLFAQLVSRSDPSRLEAWVGLGLTMTQMRVLFLLRSEPGLCAGALAERLGVTPSTLTRLMDRLVRNDLVRREADEDDRRMVRHYLRQRGMNDVEELERTGRARMNDVLSHMTPGQLQRLLVALRDLNAAMEASEVGSPKVQV